MTVQHVKGIKCIYVTRVVDPKRMMLRKKASSRQM